MDEMLGGNSADVEWQWCHSVFHPHEGHGTQSNEQMGFMKSKLREI